MKLFVFIGILGSIHLSHANEFYSPPISFFDSNNEICTEEHLHLRRKFETIKQPTAVIPKIVRESIKVGARSLEWLHHINENIPFGQKILITLPGELPQYPIDKPSIYSPETISALYYELAKTLPPHVKAIIYDNAPLTRKPGLPISEYRMWLKKIDRLYRSAKRWVSISPYLEEYKANQTRDVRGYVALSQIVNIQYKIQNFYSLPTDEKETLFQHLIGICINAKEDRKHCNLELEKFIAKNKVSTYYENYFPLARAVYNNFFKIREKRSDVVWSRENPDVATIPFRSTLQHIEKFLVDNIEAEWKWKNWNLKLIFQPKAPLHVEFQPNALPHVPEPNKIVMDANVPLDEWDVQWTIRHEFGHNLGFPDCYVEFYDETLQAMVNYQLDTQNIMCSRGGIFLKTHFNELKRVYLK